MDWEPTVYSRQREQSGRGLLRESLEFCKAGVHTEQPRVPVFDGSGSRRPLSFWCCSAVMNSTVSLPPAVGDDIVFSLCVVLDSSQDKTPELADTCLQKVACHCLLSMTHCGLLSIARAALPDLFASFSNSSLVAKPTIIYSPIR
jgi:hypothetical protein